MALTSTQIVLLGSQDCKTWFPVAGTTSNRQWTDQITTSPKSGVFKYYSVIFAGRIEHAEIRSLDFIFTERYNNRLR